MFIEIDDAFSLAAVKRDSSPFPGGLWPEGSFWDGRLRRVYDFPRARKRGGDLICGGSINGSV